MTIGPTLTPLDEEGGSRGKEIRKQIEFASQVVGQWPVWKRNILAHSSQPTNSTARSQVNNNRNDIHTQTEMTFKPMTPDEILEVVISFTEHPRSTNSRGGRHVEFGIALGQMLRVWIVGPRENVFHCMEEVRQFDSWTQAREQLQSEWTP